MGSLAGSKVSFEGIVGVGDTIPIGREKRVGVDSRQVKSIAMRQGRPARQWEAIPGLGSPASWVEKHSATPRARSRTPPIRSAASSFPSFFQAR
jgi:hypothetical protein